MQAVLAAAQALAQTTGAFAQDKVYVPLISKGFQHQFWQAVKAGADKAATDLGVEVTFEGPDNESQVDKQIDMLAALRAFTGNEDFGIFAEVTRGATIAIGDEVHA